MNIEKAVSGELLEASPGVEWKVEMLRGAGSLRMPIMWLDFEAACPICAQQPMLHLHVRGEPADAALKKRLRVFIVDYPETCRGRLEAHLKANPAFRPGMHARLELPGDWILLKEAFKVPIFYGTLPRLIVYQPEIVPLGWELFNL